MVNRMQTNGRLHAQLKGIRAKDGDEGDFFSVHNSAILEVLRLSLMMHKYGEN